MARTSRALLPLLVAALVGTVIGVAVASSREPRVVAARALPVAATAPAVVEGDWPSIGRIEPASVHPTSFLVADATVPRVELFTAPGQPAGDGLDNPTWEGLDVVFLVLGREGDWVNVRVSSRPNGRVAWVRAADVAFRRVPNWIRVEVAAKRLTVLHGDAPLMSTTVAVGKEATPTPVGSFFVDGLVLLDPPHRAYGAGQVSVSGFSPTLSSFGGGVGQIALHGTFATGLLGQETSNGCVRLDNDSILKVIDLAPTGTPVEIVP
jgi:L,D-transpeptidase catalytic domain